MKAMSTTLLENVEGVYLNRHWGGESRGVCYQITLAQGDFIVLTQRQLDLVVAAYLVARFELPRTEST